MCVFLLYWCVCTPSSRSFPPATIPASAIEYEFRAGSMIQMKCTLVRNLPLNSSILVEKSSRLKVFGLHEPRSILHLHLCRFQTLFWNFYGKSNATNPHTWILLPVDFGTFFSILEVWYSNALLSLLLFDIHHGVEVDILEDGSFKGMFSALPASRNCIPDSVLSKDLSVCVIGLRSRMYWHRIAAAAAAAAAAFWGRGEGGGFPAAWRQRFPDARQKAWPSFQRFFESCAPYSWYSTVGLEDCKHTLSKFSSNDEP